MRVRRALPWSERVTGNALWLCPVLAANGVMRRGTNSPLTNWGSRPPRGNTLRRAQREGAPVPRSRS